MLRLSLAIQRGKSAEVIFGSMAINDQLDGVHILIKVIIRGFGRYISNKFQSNKIIYFPAFNLPHT